MLAAPPNRIYAVDLQTWKSLQESRSIQIVPHSDEADIELEIWIYNPVFFAENKKIDRFSLYLSLRGTGDERVETALKNMLKETKW